MLTQARAFVIALNLITPFASTGILMLAPQKWAVLVCNFALYSQRMTFRNGSSRFWKLEWKSMCLNVGLIYTSNKVHGDASSETHEHTPNYIY